MDKTKESISAQTAEITKKTTEQQEVKGPPAEGTEEVPDAALTGEADFVLVCDGTTCFYGGDQAWFALPAYRSSACGVTAAANLIAYLERDRDARNIYTREQYISLLMEASRFVKPWRLPFSASLAIGVWPASRFVRGVLRFAGSRNTAVTANRFREPPFSAWTDTGRLRRVEAAANFISRALAGDSPAALLIGTAKKLKGIRVELPGGEGWNQKDFALHWVVATALRRTGPGAYLVRVSTWGGSAWLPLDGCLDTGIVKSRILSFSHSRKAE